MAFQQLGEGLPEAPVVADVAEGQDIGMGKGGHRLGFAGSVDLAHPVRTRGVDDLVETDSGTRCQRNVAVRSSAGC